MEKYGIAYKSIAALLQAYFRFGRDNFYEASKVANRVDIAEIHWPQFRFMVFDVPNHPGTYEDRYQHLCM